MLPYVPFTNPKRAASDKDSYYHKNINYPNCLALDELPVTSNFNRRAPFPNNYMFVNNKKDGRCDNKGIPTNNLKV